MLSIGVDTRPLFFTRGGIARYLLGLLPALFQAAPGNRYALFCPKQDPELTTGTGIPETAWQVLRLPLRNRMLESIWENLFIPYAALSGKLDVIHYPRFSVPSIRTGPAVVTIHDLAFRHYPQTLAPSGRRYFARATASAVKRANKIIAVSERTREDLLETYDIPPDRIHTVYNGIEPRFHPDDPAASRHRLRDKYSLPDAYILFLGTLEPRKNVTGIIRAFAQILKAGIPHHQLVLAGGKGWLYEDIFAMSEAPDVKPHIRFLGHVHDADLPDLYRGAACFVYPSFYEGFGLPVLEAMACGVPVVTSGTSSLPEVAGDAALLIDPHRPETIADALSRLIEDTALADNLRRRGLQRARRFSWDRTARETLKIYESCASGS